MTSPVRPERRVLLELIALLEQVQSLAAAGDRARFVVDDHYRWVIERLWIAVGNEADAYLRLANPPQQEPWRSLRRQRNELAHVRLADIDRDEVWRTKITVQHTQHRAANGGQNGSTSVKIKFGRGS